MRNLLRSALALVAIAVSAACGGGGDDDDDGGGPGGQSNMSADIDGQEWSALGNATRAGNLYAIVGLNANQGRSIAITLNNIGGTGTFPLGVNTMMYGGTGIISYNSGQGWGTPLTGVAGSITISTLTNTRIAGTFHFTGTGITGSASGELEVENGEFDMLVGGGGTLVPLPEHQGSTFTATIGGETYVAGTMSIAGAGGFLAIASNNIGRLLAINMASVTDTGTYALSTTPPARTISYNSDLADINSAQWGVNPADVGSVHITRFDALRIEGTFTATLNPLTVAATGTKAMTGSFSWGRPQLP